MFKKIRNESVEKRKKQNKEREMKNSRKGRINKIKISGEKLHKKDS